jgi:cell fate regulator YaaT (PSP1 superfamily)
MKVIGVRFKSSGRIYYFDPLEFEFAEGDGVIVETARGQEYGEVAQVAMDVEESAIVSPLKPVVRPASDADTTMRDQNCAKEGDAFRVCQQKIDQHKLDMHLVSAEYSFNGSKLVFYFTADERVDFRDLVKDLASQFRTRIELRQIGVRDEAKMLGGLGSCGRVVCCKQFLDDFHPVSIKMAKEQNLSLSPTKISGLCGRLMCCLQYEQSCYEDMKRRMPHVNRDILTPDGVGIVVDNNVITEKTKVRVTLPDGSIDLREFHYTLLAKPGEALPAQPQQAAQPAQPAQQPQAQAAVQPQRENAEAKPATENATQERNPEHKRRRRGGRGKGSPRPNGAPGQEGEAQQPRPNNNQPRPAGQQQQQQQQRRPEGQQQQLRRPEGQQPRPNNNQPRPQQGSNQQQGANQQQPNQQPRQGSAQEGQRNNNYHRRGGANRPRPNGPAPEKKEP